MILISHYSHRFAKLLGNNPVSVLATIILLSYTKILRTLIAVVYVYIPRIYRIQQFSMVLTSTISVANTFHFSWEQCLSSSLSLSTLHSLASLWSVATGHVTLEAFLMGQQCQVETIHGFLPCSLQSKASLLA